MPAPTRRGPASPMRGFLSKSRIPLRSRCALRSMPSYGSASLRAPLTAAFAGSTASHGSPLSGRPLSRRGGTRTRAKPLAALLRARVPLALTIPRARSSDGLASRMWNAGFTFVRTKPLRDVVRANHLVPAGVLADYRATRRVGSAAPLSPMRFGERKGLAGLIPQGLVTPPLRRPDMRRFLRPWPSRSRPARRSALRGMHSRRSMAGHLRLNPSGATPSSVSLVLGPRAGSAVTRAKFLSSMILATRVASARVNRGVYEGVGTGCRVFAPVFLPSETPYLRMHAFPLWMRQQNSYCKYHDSI